MDGRGTALSSELHDQPRMHSLVYTVYIWYDWGNDLACQATRYREGQIMIARENACFE